MITFSVNKVAKDFLRRKEQVDHLPKCKLKVHVIELDEAFEKLISLGTCTISPKNRDQN